MRWLVVGANGMLGQDLVAALHAAGHSVRGVDRETVDITDAGSVDAVVAPHSYDVVVNCAAWTAVDDAETHEPQAFAVNAVGPALLARAAHRAEARLVQISTDYVFAGDATTPYAEDAPSAPTSAYGRTKAAGEWAVRAEHPDHLIVRTAWLYGAHGPCFPKTMARLAATRDELTVVDDQVGQPTWTVDLAALVLRLVESGAPAGTYHGTSSGAASWFGFAQAVIAATGRPDVAVLPTSSTSYVRPAPRPAYSVLGHDALRAIGIAPIGDWAQRWAEASRSVLTDL
ncbi:dTDP-4-dehydrorhamnose reductase [Cellulomonas citrea]|uniref:dTDP-4-dehydrorhamnose reductase n=1 Tax=Cellulomonas citrea TaxID=1909423 RepID=UPI00135847A0|nr:dTDP-4-dehydrorhamnose reductase [Cellulomonas citrea]